jgi:hypothetical protein
VHQLIQRAVREALFDDERNQLARSAGDALPLFESLRANADTLYNRTPEALWQPEVHTLLFKAGHSLGESGQAAAAVAHFRDMADTAHDRLGRDHPHTEQLSDPVYR